MTSRELKGPDAQIIISPPRPLVIRFEDLLCRQLVHPEHKIEVSLNHLEEISYCVWKEQGLYFY